MYFKTLKKIVGLIGFKLIEKNFIKNERIINSRSIFNTKYLLKKIFLNFKIEYLIQIGANDGLRFDELNQFIKNKKPKSILVEPIKVYCDELKKNYSSYKNVFIENSAISTDSNKTDGYLYKVSNKFLNNYDDHVLGINSFDKNHLSKHGVKSSHIIKEEVNIISIKFLLNKYNIKKLDLLFVDAEGYDGNIIIDFLDNSNLKPIIIFEYIHINNKIIKELITKLDNKNFLYFKLNENLVCFPEEKVDLIL